jgi:hypothetical protein
MTHYILIIFLAASTGKPPSQMAIEFDDKQACESASAIYAERRKSVGTWYEASLCVAKSSERAHG